MRILVTGSEGKIGRMQVKMLREAGHEVRTFDRTASPSTEGEHLFGDLRDILAVRQAARGMEAVMHLGAIPSDRPGREDDVLSVNVQGTWNVLLASVEAGVGRVVYFSSVNALGCVGGHRLPLHFPIDDSYPRHPMTGYQLSKHLAEEACRSFSERFGIATLCLRPVWVGDPDHYQPMGARRDPSWYARELWAYVDIRDVCRAAMLCLEVQDVKHDAFLLTADDVLTSEPTAELVERHYPEIPWPAVSREEYLTGDPYRSLIDCHHAKEVLGWQPEHSWRDAPAE